MANKSGNDDRFGASDSPAGGSPAPRKSARGFASMDQGKQKEIASKGGRAAHAKGTAHEFDSSEARAAGRKGGMAVSRNREHMAAIGRRGGEARGQRARLAAQAQSASQRATEGARQNTPAGGVGSTRGVGGDREVGISGSSMGATGAAQNSRGTENALGGERRQPSSPAGGVEGYEDRA
jgi:general stress protein YciG